MANSSSFCHVFLSFRGETRDNFICYLHDALKADGFVPFMDKSDIRVGDGVDLTIKDGIKNSMSAIIVFSQKYPYSAWCLDELVLILERNRNSRYFVIPIFYDVEIKDIKHQLGNYRLALEQHRGRHHNDKVVKWREALVEVGDILGHHVQGPQNDFVQKTVKLFREKLAAKFPECRLPTPNSSVLIGTTSSSSVSNSQPIKNKVILYTRDDGRYGANSSAKLFLVGGQVIYEERNCSKERKYLQELEELVGKDKVRFPTVIVNGKDLCGEEEVFYFPTKHDLIASLNMFYAIANLA